MLLLLLFIYNQDVRIIYDQIEPVVALKGRPLFGCNPDHGRLFIPQTMVELDEQINDSDNTERSTLGIKDIHKEARVDNKGQKVLRFEKEKATLAQDLGPEIARETDIEEQRKALEEFKKAKQREDKAAPNKDVYAGGSSANIQYPADQKDYPYSNSQPFSRQSNYTQDPHQGSHQPSVDVGIGSDVVVSNSNPPMHGTITWIGTMPQVYVAGVELVSVTFKIL